MAAAVAGVVDGRRPSLAADLGSKHRRAESAAVAVVAVGIVPTEESKH